MIALRSLSTTGRRGTADNLPLERTVAAVYCICGRAYFFVVETLVMHQEALQFDALEGGGEPTSMIGPVVQGVAATQGLRDLAEIAVTARNAVRHIFRQDLEADEAGMSRLDEIVQGMWRDRWNPAEANLDLFVTHFGSLLASALLSLSGSEAIFRDGRALDHVSVFFRLEPSMEYFPFHKAYKCLTNREGESFAQLFRDARRQAGA